MYLKLSSMSTQIFLYSKRLREHSNHSKEEFLTSYAPQTLKYVHSNIFYSKRLREHANHSKEEFLTSYAPQTLKCITSYCNASKMHQKTQKQVSKKILQPQDLASFNRRLMPHLPKLRPPQSTFNRMHSNLYFH
jgi:predicted GIY-YIG superfamily endonuclease